MSILPPASEWPPKHYAPALNQLLQDDAVLCGDFNLMRHTTRGKTASYTHKFQYAGGVVGKAARFALGKPTTRNSSATVRQHDTLPFDLSVLSADVLVGTPPKFTVHPDDAPRVTTVTNTDGVEVTETRAGNQAAVDAIEAYTATDAFAASLHQAFRKCAGLGWVYARVRWSDTKQHPWIEWVDPDQGMPIFTDGELSGVIFWAEFEREDRVYRLLERHTAGRIEYELYAGKQGTLGHPVPVTEIKETEHLANILDENSGFNTGTQLLTAQMLVNVDQAPYWRRDPVLRHLGMSDVAKGGDVWSALDQAWTDLAHEVDSARARLVIPEEWMEFQGAGQGNAFDWFRDVYSKPRSLNADAEATMERVQFDMRVQQYLDDIQALKAKALSAVGWSAITFGADAQATGDMTATEIRARSTRTINTHRAKARQARATLGLLITAWQHIDADLNGGEKLTRPVDVSMADIVTDTEKDKAEKIGIYRAHGVASLEYSVRELHPEWGEEQVQAEVQAIREEQRMGEPYDPLANTFLDSTLGGE